MLYKEIFFINKTNQDILKEIYTNSKNLIYFRTKNLFKKKSFDSLTNIIIKIEKKLLKY